MATSCDVTYYRDKIRKVPDKCRQCKKKTKCVKYATMCRIILENLQMEFDFEGI